MALLNVLLFCLLAIGHASVLLEVSFDLALQQESETGYTASHTVEEYLKDPNLLWLRYLNTLVSGNAGAAPMRSAFLEFKDYQGWTTFEATNMERTHILYDLFWINWRRVMWEDDQALTVKGPERTEENPGGYLFLFRYSFASGKKDEGSQFIAQKLGTLSMQTEEGFVERRAFTNGVWQSEFTNLVWFEFSTMDALSKAVFQGSSLMTILNEAKGRYFESYASSIMVPSAGSQGGQFFKGGASQ